jgi:hypothetical protein
MKIDKYIICSCGKKKRIHWTGLAEFKRGEVSFCIGASGCTKCLVVQSHYVGNADDIFKFVSEFEVPFDGQSVH